MKYAVVRENLVDDIIECNGLTVQSLSKVLNCALVPCDQYAVQKGDTCDNWIFYRDGEALPRIPSTDERVASLENEGLSIKERMASAESAVLGLMTILMGVQ